MNKNLKQKSKAKKQSQQGSNESGIREGGHGDNCDDVFMNEDDEMDDILQRELGEVDNENIENSIEFSNKKANE